LEAAGLYRDPHRAALDAGELEAGVLDARSNDYLGLARRGVARETGGDVPLGAGGARLISGTSPEHLGLERELAEWLGVESTLLFSSAYAANVGALGCLGAAGDTIFSDALNHASIIDGCRLSRASVVVVPHRDLTALASGLRERARGEGTCWVVSETYFGMDGTSPDLPALRRVCDEHDAALVLDEAHALGLFGAEGRGLASATGVAPDLLVGGFGKALGLHGGFVAGAQVYQRWLWNRARSFVFSTAPSPLLCRWGREQLRALRAAEGPRARLAAYARRLEARLQGGGVPLPPGRHGPIFPLVLGSEAAALDAAVALRPLGVVGHAIRPPTVPAGTSRLRVILRADMSEEDVDRLGAALLAVWPARTTNPESTASDAGGAAPGGLPGGAAPAVPPKPPTGPRRWVVLATGTGVGKTFVTEGLVRELAARGHAVAGLKPIETGCRSTPEGIPVEGDAARLEAASFHVKHPRPHPLYAFTDPIAPSLASRRDGQAIEPESIASWIDRVRWLEPSLAPPPIAGLSISSFGPGVSLPGPGRGSSDAPESSNAPPSSAAPSSPAPSSSPPPSSGPASSARTPPSSAAAPTSSASTSALSSRASWRPGGPALPTERAALVIETAGGVFSPLTEHLTNFDLAHCVGDARWILVAPDRLGVLHEVVSTLHAMRSLGRAPDWLVLNAPPTPDASTGTNAAELRRLGVTTPLLCLGRDDASGLSALLEDLAPDSALPVPELRPDINARSDI